MTTSVIVAADQLEEEHISRLAKACSGWADFKSVPQGLPSEEFKNLLKKTDVLLGWADPGLLPGSALKAYLCGSAGYDAYIGIGLDKKSNFRLTNAAGIMSKPIAEHCLTLMLAFTRQLPTILAQQGQHDYERRWKAEELNETTVCIVGLGGSGTELAKRCRAMDMRTIGVCFTTSRHEGVTDVLYPIGRIEEAVVEADHVVAVLPGGPDTQHIFNEQLFTKMKRGAFFYTASRGSVTDENALIEALKTGQLGGAGLDVFAKEPLPSNSQLWDMPNVIVSPHSAGLSDRLNDRLTALFIENLNRYREGKPFLNDISLDRLV